MKRGKLIAIEGGDGAGKATQTALLARALSAHVISFPRYHTLLGAEILANLKGERAVCVHVGSEADNDDDYELAPGANALVRQALFTFDRYLAAGEIENTLRVGNHVVLDRYWLSGVIFGSSDGLSVEMLESVHRSLPQPDKWILLDISPAESIKRRPDRRDMYEKDTKAAWRRGKYLDYFNARERDQNQWVVIDGSGTIENVHTNIMKEVI